MSTKSTFCLFILIATCLRIYVANQFGMGVDEAHYILFAHHLDISYFDHPPMIGWLQSVFLHTPLPRPLQSRILAILVSALTSFLLFNYLVKKNISQKNSALSVAALNLTPIFNGLSISALPDTLLMPLTVLILQATEQVDEKPNLKNWILLGLWLGLAGLTKYTALVYIIALVAVLVVLKKYSELKNKNFWLALVLSLVCISPVAIWNYHYDFASLKYQGDHVLALNGNLIKNFFSSLGVQVGSWAIFPFIFTFIAFYKMFKARASLKKYQILFVFLNTFILFFIYIAISEVMLPHWMLIFFVLAIPITTAYALETHFLTRFLKFSYIFSGVLTLVLLLELGFRILPAKVSAGLYQDTMGWSQLMKESEAELSKLSNPKKALALHHWMFAGRASYYAEANTPITVLDDRFNQFDIWWKDSKIGYDFIIILPRSDKEEFVQNFTNKCEALNFIQDYTTLYEGNKVNQFSIFHCASYKLEK